MGRMVLRVFWDTLSGLEGSTSAWIKCSISFLGQPIDFCLLLDVTSALTPIQLALLHFLWPWEIWERSCEFSRHLTWSLAQGFLWLASALVSCCPHAWHGNERLCIAPSGSVWGTTWACWLIICSKPWFPSSPRGGHSGLSVRCRRTVSVLWIGPRPGQSVFSLGVRPRQAGFSWHLNPSLALSEVFREARELFQSARESSRALPLQ